jgi:hypothetical protein
MLHPFSAHLFAAGGWETRTGSEWSSVPRKLGQGNPLGHRPPGAVSRRRGYDRGVAASTVHLAPMSKEASSRKGTTTRAIRVSVSLNLLNLGCASRVTGAPRNCAASPLILRMTI